MKVCRDSLLKNVTILVVTVAGGYTQDIFSMWIKVIWGIQQWFISGHRNMSCRESLFFVILFWSHTQIYSWIYVIPLLGHVRSCSNSHWDPRHKWFRVPFFPNIFHSVKWFEMLKILRSDTMEILTCFGEVSVTVESHAARFESSWVEDGAGEELGMCKVFMDTISPIIMNM